MEARSAHLSREAASIFSLAACLFSVCCRHIPALCRSQKMSTAALVPQRLAWLRPKYILFAVIGVMAAYVLRHNEHFLIDAKDPEWPHIQPFKWWLLPHGLMGACALLLGPMQFSERLRRRSGCHFMDAHHRHRHGLHSQRKSPAASPMDDPQFCGCHRLSRSARRRRCHRLGSARRTRHRNDCLGLPRLLPAFRRRRPAVAGASSYLPVSCQSSDRCRSICPVGGAGRRLKFTALIDLRPGFARPRFPFSQLPAKQGASVESCAGHSVFGIVLVVLTKVPLFL